jgi:hypothetical protein
MSSLHFDFGWMPEVCNPYIETIKSIQGNKITFEGYFKLEDQVMPIERICGISKDRKRCLFHIQILEKRTVSNISKPSTHIMDKDFDHPVCLFPSFLIEMTIKIVCHIQSDQEFKEIRKSILQQDDEIMEKNHVLRREREKREYEEWVEQNRKNRENRGYQDTGLK